MLPLIALASSAAIPNPTLMEGDDRLGWRTLQPGSLYKGEWMNGAKGLRSIGPRSGVPWPHPERADGKPLRIAIPTEAVPRTLTIILYDGELDRQDVPKGSPAFEGDCDLGMLRARQGPCRLERVGRHYAYVLPPLGLHGLIHISLNMTWPLRPQTHEEIQIPWGVWLFTVDLN